MKKRSILLLLVLSAAPLILLAVLDAAWRKSEEEAARKKFLESIELSLKVIAESINSTVRIREANLLRITDTEDVSPKNMRELAATEPLVRTMFVVDAQGKLLFPDPRGDLSDNERSFLVRTRRIFTEKEQFQKGSDSSGDSGAFGWVPWYWEEGLQLLFWKKNRSGITVGAELSRAALFSEIIGELPSDLLQKSPHQSAAVVLKDENLRPMHVIGAYSVGPRENAAFTLSLREPLCSMSLSYYSSPAAEAAALSLSENGGSRVKLAAFAAVLLTCAFLFFGEMRRETRDAKNKVTFVNQVSHELKTPLTNIRMYAELLEMELRDDDEKARGYTNVITAESERLSRLILNVLTFGKKQKQTLVIRRAPCVLDDVISTVVEQLRPGLVQKGFEIHLDLNMKGEVSADADAVAQILFNLIGNAEKYAAKGEYLSIQSRRTDMQRAVIVVSDKGTGIPKKYRKKIFLPFFRIFDAVSEGKSGTGIGLAVSRDLARLHGGDIRVLPNRTGATFEVMLSV